MPNEVSDIVKKERKIFSQHTDDSKLVEALHLFDISNYRYNCCKSNIGNITLDNDKNALENLSKNNLENNVNYRTTLGEMVLLYSLKYILCEEKDNARALFDIGLKKYNDSFDNFELKNEKEGFGLLLNNFDEVYKVITESKKELKDEEIIKKPTFIFHQKPGEKMPGRYEVRS